MKAILVAAFIYHSFGWICAIALMSLLFLGLYRFARYQIRHAEVRRAEHDDIVERAYAENAYFLAGDPLGVNGMYTPPTLPMTGYLGRPDWSGIIQTPVLEQWREFRQTHEAPRPGTSKHNAEYPRLDVR